MGTSIASQLQALKSLVKADGAEPVKRPFTRPSILFDPKEAADIDLDTLFSIAISGLEFLINMDERFTNYRNDLFSHKSKEVDRELLGIQENNQINSTISSYLRLVSGYLELSAAVRTLEYLIRRYKIHVYNAEDLILCSLPYHDTHVFVRIVQLIPSGNSKWKFLDGVREKGAPPPRQVIVQQCVRDFVVLEALCNYATPTKKSQPSKNVISFSTAVIVEVLSSVATVESDVVQKILPFVSSGLQPGAKRALDQKASALIIISSLAVKVALSPTLVKSLLRPLADVARVDAGELADMQWVRMSIMAFINLVQLQSVTTIPRKTLDVLNEIRNISMVLKGLSKEFNIDKFLAIMLDSLIEYSLDDDRCLDTLLSILENVPIKGLIDRVVFKLLNTCLKISRNKNDAAASGSGSYVKQILISILRKYPFELREAVHKVLQDTKWQSKKEQSNYEVVCQMLEGNLDMSHALSDSKIWFALEHPKAEVRRKTLSGLDVTGILSVKATDSQRFDTIQDAILRRLRDDDLGVVQEVITLERLSEIISPPCLLDALQDVLQRCIGILNQSTPSDRSLACAVAISALQCAILSFHDQSECAPTLAKMTFPLMLVRPKTQDLNLKALELAKKVKWPLYLNLTSLSSTEKKLEKERVTSFNLENISALTESFLTHHEEYISWLVDCSDELELSKTLFFLILLQSFMMPEKDLGRFFLLVNDCLPVLKTEWGKLDIQNVLSPEKLDGSCKVFLERLFDTRAEELNAEIITCLFWRLLEAFFKMGPDNVAMEKKGAWVQTARDLFVFFTSQTKNLFRDHLHELVMSCKVSPRQFLLELFTEEGASVAVQVESLSSFTHLCSQSEGSMTLEFLAEFPAILVPLSSDNQDVRVAAMCCIEGLNAMCSRINLARSKNGSSASKIHFLGELLGLMVQQKRLILSDKDVLPSFFTSLLSSSGDSLLVQQTVGKRFDESTKKDILVFILGSALGLSAYAKLEILSLLKGLGSRVLLIKGVELLLHDLLKRRQHDKLSKAEVGILCVLLECCSLPTSSLGIDILEDPILKALQLNGMPIEDPAVLEPCLTALSYLSSSLYGGLKTENQDLLFQALVLLFRTAKADVQIAAREALLRIDINYSTVCRTLDSALDQERSLTGSQIGKKKKSATSHHKSNVGLDLDKRGENSLSFISSLLDVLLLKKSMQNRTLLVGSLFRLLQVTSMDGGWVQEAAAQDSDSQTISGHVIYIQQTVLLLLEDIISSVVNDTAEKANIDKNFDLELLVNCARTSSDAVTRNHVFSLLSAIAKVIPVKVLDHILDILVVTGESALTQWDSYSHRVFEDLISSVVPCWLSKTDDTNKLLQIFVDILPQVSGNRRLSIIMPLLRNLGGSSSLGSLLFLLFCSVSAKESLSCVGDQPSLDRITSVVATEWEYVLAMQLTEQFPCMMWLPAIVLLLKQIGTSAWTRERFMELVVSMQFISEKLQDPEIAFKLDSGEDSDSIQRTISALMEQVVFHMQLVNLGKKQIDVSSAIRKELQEYMRSVLKTITRSLIPSTYFKAIIQLLGHVDKNVKKKALQILCESVKEFSTTNQKREKRGASSRLRKSWLHLDEIAQESFKQMFLEILKLIDDSTDKLASLKLAAVSTLEVLANWFPSDSSVLSLCLGSIGRGICSDDSAVSSSCLRTTGALISVLGPRTLPELPSIMKSVLRKAQDVFSSVTAEIKKGRDQISVASSHTMESLSMAILIAIEAVVDKLGGFLNPFLGDILELLLLRPQYALPVDLKLKSKADVVRKLITHKTPVRLLLPSLMRICSDAIASGDSSLLVAFEMLGNLVATMDRSSIGAYHAKIFESCLLALDLRRQRPALVKNIDVVEKSVIDAMVALTMKLTETMFRPLFIKSIEWSISNLDDGDSVRSKKIDRAISFYGLVNKLAESHRSLFVPYFKYLLDGCIQHLTDAEDAKVDLIQKRKKVKLQKASDDKKGSDSSTSFQSWHLRALVLSSLHKCFLYDAGSLKFLDSSNFQTLLKPLVSQLVTDPPASLEQNPSVPSVEEVDDLLVGCIGQMAVTAGSDLLWKPLNHEVLMQTRSEKVRSRILGLRIVKYLVENLKEEYLVLLAETIPFLGELLEDVELSVKSLAQEILKDMESMSGESLREYL